MLLAIDIGNSSIKFGIYEPEGLLHKFSVATWRDYAPEELFFDRFRYVEEKFVRVDAVVVSSVVPEVNPTLTKASLELFRVTPQFIDSSTDIGLKIKCDPPSGVGPDRLVGAFEAARKHGVPCVIASFGTATVVDAVSGDREFLGGVIAPGLRVMAEALHLKTSLLPRVNVQRPDHLIGRNTADAVLSGVYFGSVAMADGLIHRVVAEASEDGRSARPRVVATGGFGKLILDELPVIDVFEELLVLDGLRGLAEGSE